MGNKTAEVLITMYDSRTFLSREVTGMLEEHTRLNGVRIFNTRIPRSTKVGEAALYGQTICEYEPKHPAALAYENFVKELTELEIAKLIPFPGHPFKLYSGERLEKMTESIREHGVLEPVLVWLKHDPDSDTDTFIILSGHNRVNASKRAGLDKVPVRIMENLTENEVALIVTETNLHQRSFADLAHSEQALAIHAHYGGGESTGSKRTAGGSHRADVRCSVG